MNQSRRIAQENRAFQAPKNDGNIDVVHILNDKRACRVDAGGPTEGSHGRLNVDEPAVQKGDGANGVARHVNADLAIVDVEGLVRPTPVPQLHDGCFGAVEGEVAHRVLLIAELGALLASVEDQVRQHATASFFYEDAGVIILGSGGQLEDAVLDRSSLG